MKTSEPTFGKLWRQNFRLVHHGGLLLCSVHAATTELPLPSLSSVFNCDGTRGRPISASAAIENDFSVNVESHSEAAAAPASAAPPHSQPQEPLSPEHLELLESGPVAQACPLSALHMQTLAADSVAGGLLRAVLSWGAAGRHLLAAAGGGEQPVRRTMPRQSPREVDRGSYIERLSESLTEHAAVAILLLGVSASASLRAGRLELLRRLVTATYMEPPQIRRTAEESLMSTAQKSTSPSMYHISGVDLGEDQIQRLEHLLYVQSFDLTIRKFPPIDMSSEMIQLEHCGRRTGLATSPRSQHHSPKQQHTDLEYPSSVGTDLVRLYRKTIASPRPTEETSDFCHRAWENLVAKDSVWLSHGIEHEIWMGGAMEAMLYRLLKRSTMPPRAISQQVSGFRVIEAIEVFELPGVFYNTCSMSCTQESLVVESPTDNSLGAGTRSHAQVCPAPIPRYSQRSSGSFGIPLPSQSLIWMQGVMRMWKLADLNELDAMQQLRQVETEALQALTEQTRVLCLPRCLSSPVSRVFCPAFPWATCLLNWSMFFLFCGPVALWIAAVVTVVIWAFPMMCMQASLRHHAGLAGLTSIRNLTVAELNTTGATFAGIASYCGAEQSLQLPYDAAGDDTIASPIADVDAFRSLPWVALTTAGPLLVVLVWMSLVWRFFQRHCCPSSPRNWVPNILKIVWTSWEDVPRDATGRLLSSASAWIQHSNSLWVWFPFDDTAGSCGTAYMQLTTADATGSILTYIVSVSSCSVIAAGLWDDMVDASIQPEGEASTLTASDTEAATLVGLYCILTGAIVFLAEWLHRLPHVERMRLRDHGSLGTEPATLAHWRQGCCRQSHVGFLVLSCSMWLVGLGSYMYICAVSGSDLGDLDLVLQHLSAHFGLLVAVVFLVRFICETKPRDCMSCCSVWICARIQTNELPTWCGGLCQPSGAQYLVGMSVLASSLVSYTWISASSQPWVPTGMIISFALIMIYPACSAIRMPLFRLHKRKVGCCCCGCCWCCFDRSSWTTWDSGLHSEYMKALERYRRIRHGICHLGQYRTSAGWQLAVQPSFRQAVDRALNPPPTLAADMNFHQHLLPQMCDSLAVGSRESYRFADWDPNDLDRTIALEMSLTRPNPDALSKQDATSSMWAFGSIRVRREFGDAASGFAIRVLKAVLGDLPAIGCRLVRLHLQLEALLEAVEYTQQDADKSLVPGSCDEQTGGAAACCELILPLGSGSIDPAEVRALSGAAVGAAMLVLGGPASLMRALGREIRSMGRSNAVAGSLCDGASPALSRPQGKTGEAVSSAAWSCDITAKAAGGGGGRESRVAEAEVLAVAASTAPRPARVDLAESLAAGEREWGQALEGCVPGGRRLAWVQAGAPLLVEVGGGRDVYGETECGGCKPRTLANHCDESASDGNSEFSSE